MRRKVVITGMGLVSSLGDNLTDFWESLVSGKSGISEVTSFDTSPFSHRYGGEVKGFDSGQILSEAEKEVYGRATQFSIVAAHHALLDSNLLEALPDLGERIGVVMGTTFGEAQIVEKATRHLVEGKEGQNTRRLKLRQYLPNTLSVNLAKKFGFCGPNSVLPTACAAGNYALAYGVSLIRSGRVEIVIAGGTDPFSHVSFSGFSRLGVMAATRCQPFDKNRKGMLVGEGAAILVLENYDSARNRGAKSYGEILGYGLNCDANHMTIPEVGGISAVMEKAVRNSGIGIQEVDYVCAHGTGTLINDKTESLAIRKVFYERGHEVAVSSIKSMLGHTMGAAGALEAVASVLAIQHNEIPPTMNHETPDPECGIDCVPNESRKKNLDVVLNNSFAFGGNNACVVLARI